MLQQMQLLLRSLHEITSHNTHHIPTIMPVSPHDVRMSVMGDNKSITCN